MCSASDPATENSLDLRLDGCRFFRQTAHDRAASRCSQLFPPSYPRISGIDGTYILEIDASATGNDHACACALLGLSAGPTNPIAPAFEGSLPTAELLRPTRVVANRERHNPHRIRAGCGSPQPPCLLLTAVKAPCSSTWRFRCLTGTPTAPGRAAGIASSVLQKALELVGPKPRRATRPVRIRCGMERRANAGSRGTASGM